MQLEKLADEILTWPDSLIAALPQQLLDSSQRDANRENLLALQHHGLISEDQEKTEAGRRIEKLLRSEIQQIGDEIDGLIESECDPDLQGILEIGCSTGYGLRHKLAGFDTRKVGLDVDFVALALANRFASLENQRISFLRRESVKLDFDDDEFDLILCRNALTYMPQERTLRELARVLRPGGLLILRFENILFDLNKIKRTKKPKLLFRSCIDLGWGLLQNLLRLPIEPGLRAYQPRRTYASRSSIERYLRGTGCSILKTVETTRCPILFGKPSQNTLLISRTNE